MNTAVRGADRALTIFEAFEATRRQLTLREIASLCDLPVSSCHALLRTLHQRGYLYSLGSRKELYPTRRLFTLAQTLVENDPFLARITSDLEALRDAFSETITVGKRQGDVLQYIYTLDCPRPIRYAAKPGDFRPLHSTAGGKALLSVLPDDELERWLRGHPLKAMNPKTITSVPRLVKDIVGGRKRGYFVASGEHSDDLDAVAVPIQLYNDVITIAVAGPASRMRPAVAKVGARLLALKSKLEGSSAPEPATISPARVRTIHKVREEAA